MTAHDRTGINISSRLSEIADEWGIKIVVSTITDNRSNVRKTICLLDSWPKIDCFAHSLQLVIHNGLETNDIDRLRAFSRHLVKFFKVYKGHE